MPLLFAIIIENNKGVYMRVPVPGTFVGGGGTAHPTSHKRAWNRDPPVHAAGRFENGARASTWLAAPKRGAPHFRGVGGGPVAVRRPRCRRKEPHPVAQAGEKSPRPCGRRAMFGHCAANVTVNDIKNAGNCEQ